MSELFKALDYLGFDAAIVESVCKWLGSFDEPKIIFPILLQFKSGFTIKYLKGMYNLAKCCKEKIKSEYWWGEGYDDVDIRVKILMFEIFAVELIKDIPEDK